MDSYNNYGALGYQIRGSDIYDTNNGMRKRRGMLKVYNDFSMILFHLLTISCHVQYAGKKSTRTIYGNYFNADTCLLSNPRSIRVNQR